MFLWRDVEDMTVLGVNCSQLLDREVFEKQERRTRCGVCYNCSQGVDCGRCKVGTLEDLRVKQTNII